MDSIFLGIRSNCKPSILKIILAITIIFGLGISCVAGTMFSLVSFFYCLSITVLGIALEIFTWYVFFAVAETSGEQEKVLIRGSKPLLVCFAVAFVVSCLLGVMELQQVSWKIACVRCFAYFVILLFVADLVVFLKNRVCLSREMFSQACVYLVIAIAALLISLLGTFLAGMLLDYSFAGLFFLCFTFMFPLMLSIYFFVKDKPSAHIVYPFTIICIGLLLIVVLPAKPGACWDEEIHYSRTVGVSNIVGLTYTPQDILSFTITGTVDGVDIISVKDELTQDDIQRYEESLDGITYTADDVIDDGLIHLYYGNSLLDPMMISYTPAAIGLWVGRHLMLPYSVVMRLGKLFNLLFYVLLITLAIRITPIKKNLIGVISITPTIVFLASSFAYDFWVSGFLFLATSIIIRERMHDGPPITNLKLALLLFIFFLAFLPKPIYVPFLGLVLLIPKRRFVSVRQRRMFIIASLLMVLYVSVSFAAPFVSDVGMGTAGDSRGGAGVDGGGQLAWIAGNFGEFITILGTFMFGTFMNPANMTESTCLLAYLGRYEELIAHCLTVLIILLALFDDHTPLSKGGTFVSNAWALFLYFLTAALVATALYIAYTPVGYPAINGCQFRYLIPMYFPAFAFGLDLHTKWRLNTRIVAIVSEVVGLICCCTVLYFLVVAAVIA